VKLLLIEDNPADVEITRLSLEEAKLQHELHVAENGNQGMAFLNRQAPYQAAPRPDLVLLDLNLPGKDGRAVLAEIKNDEKLKDVPVVILSTSSAEADVVDAYKMHANGYLAKPTSFDAWVELFRAVRCFWFAKAQLPTRIGAR
jgi:two-component system response regulator